MAIIRVEDAPFIIIYKTIYKNVHNKRLMAKSKVIPQVTCDLIIEMLSLKSTGLK